jgi:hypothetical protein
MMLRQSDYQIITSAERVDLESRINKLLHNGWLALGGVAIDREVRVEDRGEVVTTVSYAQAVIKVTRESEE